MSNAREIGTETFQAEVLNSTTPVLVDFYAPWCGPCKMLSPILDSLSAEFAGRVKFVKVNVDDAPDLPNRYAITGVPTLILFEGGRVRDTIVGLVPARVLRTKLQSVAGAAEPDPVLGRG